MKLIDRYIIRKFLTTFFFIMGVIMLIAVVFDISENIDDFLESNAPVDEVILDYYVNFIIFYGNLFSPLLIFLTVIFFTSKMAARSEIVAILSSGVSFHRMMIPYFIAATVIAIGSFYLNHRLIPKANKHKIAFEHEYMDYPYRFRDRQFHRQIRPGEFIYLDRYNNVKEIGREFSIEKWEDNKLKLKIMSRLIRWDSTNGKWNLTDYHLRRIDGEKEELQFGRKMDTTFHFYPDYFERQMDNIGMMNTTELTQYIEQEKLEGSSQIPFYEIEKHQRTSLPFASYILTLIGVSISSRKTRGGIGLHLALGLVFAVVYILCLKVATVYATNAGLDPLTAVWLPNIIFAVLSVVLYRYAPK